MVLSRVQTLYTFRSASGGVDYYFDMTVDALGQVEAKNFRSPLGLIRDPVTGLPRPVLDDMLDAREIVRQLGTETNVASGTLVFNGVTSVNGSILPGTLNNTSYRVAYSTPDGTVLRTANQTTTGFTAVAPTTYGTIAAPISVPYVVLVATLQASTTSGLLTFIPANNSVQSVTFSQAFTTDDYRVILTPSDFFVARVINKTRSGFSVEISYTLGAAESVTVGYDVFVG